LKLFCEFSILFVRLFFTLRLLVEILYELARVLLEKLIVTQLVQKFTALYGTRRFIIMFWRPRYWSLPWVRCIQSTPSHPISLRSILSP